MALPNLMFSGLRFGGTFALDTGGIAGARGRPLITFEVMNDENTISHLAGTCRYLVRISSAQRRAGDDEPGATDAHFGRGRSRTRDEAGEPLERGPNAAVDPHDRGCYGDHEGAHTARTGGGAVLRSDREHAR